MQLVRPSVEYQDSYLSFVEEFKAAENASLYPTLRDLDFAEVQNDFAAYVQKLHDREKGINLPEGYIPDTHFWAIEDGEVVGQIPVRHELTEALKEHGGHIGYAVRPSVRGRGVATAMLRLALVEAKKLGVERVLIGCNETNIASKRVIEKNGGVLERKGVNPENGGTTLHYWIEL